MHDSPKLTSFIALRANGWSLASISREIDVPKSTLWRWDDQHRNDILRLKQLQLENLQEKFLPTHEEELLKLRSYLDRIEAALEKEDFEYMETGYLLQTALQLRTRLARLCHQTSLPLAGCISRQKQFQADEVAELLADSENENGTKRYETPPGVQNKSLNTNDLQNPPEDARTILQSQPKQKESRK